MGCEMNSDLKSVKEETLRECIKADASWELQQAKVAEGPSLLKRNGVYYLIYSANHFRSQDYAVGYATATSPLGPWKKYDGNPILCRDKDVLQDWLEQGMEHLFYAGMEVTNIFIMLIRA